MSKAIENNNDRDYMFDANVEIKAKNISLVKIGNLKEHPKNPNKHGSDQIDRLVKIIKSQGFRSPVVVSNLSGYVVAGHGRLMAAKRLKLKELPVMYQDFDNEEMEYAHMVADNSLGEWSFLDLGQINQEVENLGPDFNIELLGIKNFALDISEHGFSPPADFESDKKHKVCPHCGEAL